MSLKGFQVTSSQSLNASLIHALQEFHCNVNEQGEKRKVYP